MCKNNSILIKTATITVLMNIFLTGIKFLLFFFSGSCAILAEAWHSLTDIATSSLVLMSINTKKKQKIIKDNKNQSLSNKITTRFLYNTEALVSFGIGILLIIVAVFLIKEFIQTESQKLEYTLVSGLIFVALSFCSYFISRFESQIGYDKNSIGLISDGMHAKSDMIASLLTGISLILYSTGLDIDRQIAGIIAIFIAFFAIETIINVIESCLKDDSKGFVQNKTLKIIVFIFQKKTFVIIFNSIKILLQKIGFTKYTGLIARFIIISPFLIILIAYLSTCFFVINTNEQAIIERFGRPVNADNPTGPGLNIKYPYPIDNVKKVNTKTIKDINIANVKMTNSDPLLWTTSHDLDEVFLTGDNNFCYPYIVLHYRINNLYNYLYKNSNVESMLKGTARRIISHLFAYKSFYDIAGIYRKNLEKEMQKKLQELLDKMESGIEIISVIFKDIHPPISIADAFEDVIAGYQEKQKYINQALGLKNKLLPTARADAIKSKEDALAYIVNKTNIAQGQAERYKLLQPENEKQKNINMTRIYLQTMKQVLAGKTLYIIESDIGKQEIFMNKQIFSGFND